VHLVRLQIGHGSPHEGVFAKETEKKRSNNLGETDGTQGRAPRPFSHRR
jgi:hypothetical protein